MNFSEWGEDSQVKFSPFKSLRNSFRRLIGKEELPKKSKMKTDDAEGNPQDQPIENQSADQSPPADEAPTEQSAITPSNSNETEPQPPKPNENNKKKSSACIIL